MHILWVYQGNGNRWYGHVDFHDGLRPKRRGPFESERQAAVVVSRMNGLLPPEEFADAIDRDIKSILDL